MTGFNSCFAEDRGFEPLRALTQHAFQACALGHYANPPPPRLSPPLGWPEIVGVWALFQRIRRVAPAPIHVDSGQPLVRRHRAEPPQGRKAARVGVLCRVHGGSLHQPEPLTLAAGPAGLPDREP